MTRLALRVAGILAAGLLLLLAACASDGARETQVPTCPTSADDSNWTDVDSFSKDDIAWFNTPGNFAQYSSTCQTAAITALVVGNQYGKGDEVDTDPAKAIEWMQKSAAMGDVEAENQLGYLYSVKYGNGYLPAEMRDDQKAFQWWGRAAAQGNLQAANMFASMYWMGTGTTKDYCGATGMLLKFANTGDHTAALQLGQCYENGWSVPRDDAKARYWLRQAQGDGNCLGCIDTRKELAGLGASPTGSAAGAQQLDEHDQKLLDRELRAAAKGEVAAELWLGKVYLTGVLDGKPFQADRTKSFAWYSKAADKGSAAGEDDVGNAYLNGLGVKQDYTQAVSWYSKAAAKGDVDAEDSLGYSYWSGQGVSRDYAKAHAWYRKAADKGDALGEDSVGNDYWNGWGVKQDYRRGLAWYRKAAAKGYASADDSIGYAYWAGQGVTQDYAQSFAWYQKAADKGDAAGEYCVGNAYRNGWGVKRDDAQAVAWYQKAADQGYADAEVWLAHAYFYGQGVRRDHVQSLAWYQRAADQGNADAEYSVGNAYRNGWGVQQDLGQAAAWYQKASAAGSADARQALADVQSQQMAAQASSDTPQSDASDSQSPAEWQQDHQAKIDELTQEIANHEQQAQQDDANADQAEAQLQQNANASESGPGSTFLALGNLVEGGLSAGLAVKERQDAADERRQAQEERAELAKLGAEQPPVAHNDSETMALTQMQTQMIRSGNTIEGQTERERNQILALGNAAAARDSQPRAAAVAQPNVADAGAVPQGPPSGPVTVIFRGLTSSVAGQAVVTETLNRQTCPPDCSFSFPAGSYSINFFAQANSQSIFRGFEGGCTGGGGTAPETPGNSGGCALGSPPSQASTITVLVDPVSPAGQTAASSESGGSASPSGAISSGSGMAPSGTGNGNAGPGQYVQPMASGCVRMFDDPSMNGWVSLQNTCSQAMTVTFVGKNGNGSVWGTMDLSPGKSGNTGRSPSEIDAVGGLYWYPCPYTFIPVTMAGQTVGGSTPVTEYTCKYRGY